MVVALFVVGLLGALVLAQLAGLSEAVPRMVDVVAPAMSSARIAARGVFGRASAARRRISKPPRDDGASRRIFVGAIAVGAILRLLWVIWATRNPTELRDPAEYLRVASDFGHGMLPRFGGDIGGSGGPSAYWPPGYPALLAPFVWVAEQTGWISRAFVASLVNVVAGTVTIALTGFLAARLIGARARNLSAWLVALWPALIYWTSTAHSETAFTPFLLGISALAIVIIDTPTRIRWVLLGVLVAFAFLVRSPGAIGFVVPAITIRTLTGSWRGSVRATGLVVLGACVLLVPWTIRNGVQVGVWSPASTNNASAACFGHHDEAPPIFSLSTRSDSQNYDCFGGSPYDDRRFRELYAGIGDPQPPGAAQGEPDEARWYRRTMGKAIRWALTHPTDEVGRSALNVARTWGNDARVVDGARQFAEPGWAGRWQSPLTWLTNLWLWAVGLLALLGLALVPACRRALPLWVPIVLLTILIMAGVAEPHYRFPVLPLVAILAAAFVHRQRTGETISRPAKAPESLDGQQ